jgi:hypothetical protein
MQATRARLCAPTLLAVAVLCAAGAALVTPAGLRAQARPAPPGAATTATTATEPFVVEYYYRVRWGGQDEFLQLFRKNHLPILEAEQKLGVIREIRMDQPREHLPEEARWDYRVTLVYPSVAAYAGPALPAAERRRMYPDSAAFAREERRRFELLLAHWDVPVVPVTRAP